MLSSSLTQRREALTEDARRLDYEAVRPKRHRTGLQKSGLPKHDRCPLMRPRVEQRHRTEHRLRRSPPALTEVGVAVLPRLSQAQRPQVRPAPERA